MVHQILNPVHYAVWSDKEEFIADLKAVYNAPNINAAHETLIPSISHLYYDYPMASFYKQCFFVYYNQHFHAHSYYYPLFRVLIPKINAIHPSNQQNRMGLAGHPLLKQYGGAKAFSKDRQSTLFAKMYSGCF